MSSLCATYLRADWEQTMSRMSVQQALFAGIGGASIAFMPHTALAMTFGGMSGNLLSSPFAPFIAGVIGGTAVAGCAYGIIVKAAEYSDSKGTANARMGVVKDAPAPVRVAEAPVAASIYKPRHMSSLDFEKSGVIRVIPAQPYVAPEPEPVAAPAAPATPASQKHFKSSIIDRFGATMMQGIPVIERADGTVGDVGTSWWEHGIEGRHVVSDTGFADERPVDAFLHDKNRLTPQTITHRVAQIDEGLYPELRTADDLDKSDMWTSALEALDEKLGTSKQPKYSMSFIDTVGGHDTLDEPEGLEKDTDFIPFRVPAGHPEVVDTNSYINHLVSDEFSRSSSDTARTSSRHYLKVIDGGTHNLKTKGSFSASKTGTNVYVGKHFAPLAAAEA